MRDFFSIGFLVCIGMPLTVLIGRNLQWWQLALVSILCTVISCIVADFIWEIFE